MYKEILRSIAGIEIFPVVSLLLFVTVFTVVLVWTCSASTARGSRSAQPAARRHHAVRRRGGHDATAARSDR